MPPGEIRSYRDLKVWQDAMTVAEDCYRVTASFPRHELFGMTAQIRRASVSVAANIAEGYGRESKGFYVQFLRNAQGSLKELETHLLLCQRVGLVLDERANEMLAKTDTIGRMLRSLIRSFEGQTSS